MISPLVPRPQRNDHHFCLGRACPGHPSRRMWRTPWMPGPSPGMTDPKPRRRLRSCLPNRHVVGPHVPSRQHQAPHFCPGRACPGHPSRRVWRGRMDARAKPWHDRPEATSQTADLRCRTDAVGAFVPSRQRNDPRSCHGRGHQDPRFCPGRACPGHPSRRVWRGRMDARAKPWHDRPETTSQAAILRSLCRPVFPRGPKRPAVSPGPSSSGPAEAIRGAPPHENRFRAGRIGISGLFPGEQRSAGRSGKVVTVGIESDPRPNLEANGDQP